MRISDWSSDVCSSDLLAQIETEAGGRPRTAKGAPDTVVTAAPYQRIVPALGVNRKHHARMIAVATAHIGQIDAEIVFGQSLHQGFEFVKGITKTGQIGQLLARLGNEIGRAHV